MGTGQFWSGRARLHSAQEGWAGIGRGWAISRSGWAGIGDGLSAIEPWWTGMGYLVGRNWALACRNRLFVGHELGLGGQEWADWWAEIGRGLAGMGILVGSN
jgi:hypothetical protein